MKLKLLVLFAIIFSCATGVFAQEDDTVAAPEVMAEPAPVNTTAPRQTMTAPASQARVAPAAKPKSIDSIKGNAGKDVALVDASGSCASGLKSVGVVNKSTTRAMKVGVEVMVVFMGRMSKKNLIIDDLAPNETRYVGCAGCIANATGKTCTTYKIFAAMYK